jgi:transcription antitermination factor NusG
MPWLLAVVEHDEATLDRVVRAGYDPMMVYVRRLTVRRGIVEKRLSPAFPGYIFVRFPDSVRRLLEVSGIFTFVKWRSTETDELEVATVSDAVVDALTTDAEEIGEKRYVLAEPEREELFSVGDRVRVIGSSIWAGKYGTIREIGGASIAVGLKMFSKEVLAKFEEFELTVVSARRNRRRRKYIPLAA